jgi:hypothetical protein
MFSDVKPSAETNAGNNRTKKQPYSIQLPEGTTITNTTHNYRNEWADTAGQLDYFGTALWSISPIRRSDRPASTVKMAGQQTYPSQELNPRYAGLHLSPPNSAGSWNPPPPPPPLSPHNIDGLARKLHVEEVTSIATLTEHPRHIASKIHVKKVTSMATGFRDRLDDLDFSPNSNKPGEHNFQIANVGAGVIAAQSKCEELDANDYCSRSNVPIQQKHHASQDGKNEAALTVPTKVTKCSTKKTSGIAVPNNLDILRGRGGLTNRHEGNKRFRDEARKLRTTYRHENTNREEKFLLSQELCRRVKEYGGRFLELGPDHLWYEMNEHGARKKASQGMNTCSFVCSSQLACILTLAPNCFLSTSRGEMGVMDRIYIVPLGGWCLRLVEQSCLLTGRCSNA